ncbi:MAG: hypothetical protein RQ756_03300 [Flavobacteriaceae bacterium]|nr:hypothetical protein [Flavobacteriaceae bacterium]
MNRFLKIIGNCGVLCLVFLAFSCEEKKTTTTSDLYYKDSVFQSISNIPKIKSLPSPEATTIMQEWITYQNFLEQLKSIKLSLPAIKNLSDLAQKLDSTMPDTLNVPPIQARLEVLKTKIQVLHQYVQRQTPEAAETFAHLNTVIISCDQLNENINDKLERDRYTKVIKNYTE